MEEQDFEKAISQLPEEFQILLLDKVKTNKDYISSLKSKFTIFNEVINFKKGDLVVWKTGLKNRKIPIDYGTPFIVIELLDKPIFDTDQNSAGSPLFREPLDIILGTVDDDGDLLTYHYDKRRFKLFNS